MPIKTSELELLNYKRGFAYSRGASPAGFSPVDPFDANVVLYIKGEGPNGSTNITDDKGKTVAVFGGTQISNIRSAQGDSSVLMQLDGDYLRAGVNTDWTFLHDRSDSWTMECYAYFNASGSFEMLYTTGDRTTQVGATLYKIDTDALQFFISKGSSPLITFITTTALVPIGQFVHLAACYDGVDYYLAIDGTVEQFSATGTPPISDPTFNLWIGQTSGAPSFSFIGNLDAMRITEGIARYTSNFDPLTDTFFQD